MRICEYVNGRSAYNTTLSQKGNSYAPHFGISSSRAVSWPDVCRNRTDWTAKIHVTEWSEDVMAIALWKLARPYLTNQTMLHGLAVTLLLFVLSFMALQLLPCCCRRFYPRTILPVASILYTERANSMDVNDVLLFYPQYYLVVPDRFAQSITFRSSVSDKSPSQSAIAIC